MKKHLIFILIFILVVPIWTISWLWSDAASTHAALEQCQIGQSVLSPQSKFSYGNQSKLIVLSFFFFLLGGYFFWEYMRILGETARKVSFVNQVSHELKTPLTNILLYADLLKETVINNADAKKKIEVIGQESQRLNRLVDNLLMFLRGYELTIQKQEHDVDAIIVQIVESFRGRFDEKKIAIEIQSKAGRYVLDKGLFEQILVNLIGNVEKYAAVGGFMKIVAWAGDGHLHVTVHDKGSGIPPHMRSKIFKPFVRGQNNLTDGVSGIGIGLPLAANLARLHGGELRLVDSEIGACFEVIL